MIPCNIYRLGHGGPIGMVDLHAIPAEGSHIRIFKSDQSITYRVTGVQADISYNSNNVLTADRVQIFVA